MGVGVGVGVFVGVGVLVGVGVGVLVGVGVGVGVGVCVGVGANVAVGPASPVGTRTGEGVFPETVSPQPVANIATAIINAINLIFINSYFRKPVFDLRTKPFIKSRPHKNKQPQTPSTILPRDRYPFDKNCAMVLYKFFFIL